MDNESFKPLKFLKNYLYKVIHFLMLLKPGILLGNSLTFLSGFLIASKNQFELKYFLISLISLISIIGSACIINNIFDRDIDRQMNRTKNRFLCNSNIFMIFLSYLYSFFLLFLGFFLCYQYNNLFCLILFILGFFIYTVIYTIFLKRKKIYATLIGGISGSLPPLIGYVTIQKKFDICSIILFLVYFFWQIPHTFSISIYCLEDYQNIKIPTYFIKKGILKSQIIIISSIFLNFLFLLLLSVYISVNFLNYFILCFFYFFWIFFSIFGRFFLSDKKWSYYIFIFSLFVIFLKNIFFLNFL
ncbi:protoheme IX farnesyltransferase [Buchnera aphidicola]|uniref:protoheme IX farnesyltransferase n=1 Tax=Buchnera aphidicola TaxID=9 RepID=UPI0031B6F011